MSKAQPFHLQQTNEDEVILPAVEDDENVPKDETTEEREKREEEEKKAGVKRVKVGKIELDPDIGGMFPSTMTISTDWTPFRLRRL